MKKFWFAVVSDSISANFLRNLWISIAVFNIKNTQPRNFNTASHEFAENPSRNNFLWGKKNHLRRSLRLLILTENFSNIPISVRFIFHFSTHHYAALFGEKARFLGFQLFREDIYLLFKDYTFLLFSALVSVNIHLEQRWDFSLRVFMCIWVLLVYSLIFELC